MSGLTKRRPTELTEIRLIGPITNTAEILEYAKSRNFVDVSDSVPWREAFDNRYDFNELPGVALRGARVKEGLTQKQLSKITGIPQGHISAMENGKRDVGKVLAKKLEKALNIDYRIFL